MLMPFGKYAGVEMSTIPRGYSVWIRDNLDLRPPLCEAIDAVLAGRPDRSPAKTLRAPPTFNYLAEVDPNDF
jgi:hypothetical protein